MSDSGPSSFPPPPPPGQGSSPGAPPPGSWSGPGAGPYAASPRYCSACGTLLGAGAVQCFRCGTPSKVTFPGQKSKLVAGLLGILVPFGVHSFYLGDTKKGVIQLLVTIFTCGIASLWSFIEGILILVGNISTDAEGRPLGD